ncbi:L-2-hydroxyglutarate oxidase [Fodinibius sp. SL11]|uniref:L-2-hydroxyglutarate oxidase n=1 Tax=Fodinibius sp. SL11 TaxID=3425690 RepID=UPI003F885C1E
MKYDIAIIGAGIIGGALAYKLSEEYQLKIVVIDKEARPSQHQTGRNSGIIHSGVYYPENSLKSKNCINGYKQLIQFLEENSITYKITGKLIAAANETEFSELDRLFENAQSVGLGVQYLTEKEIRKIDPNLTIPKGFFVEETGLVDYSEVLNKFINISSDNGVDFIFGASLNDIAEKDNKYSLSTNGKFFQTKYVINCAGLQCDRVFELLTGQNSPVKILPFKGEYFEVTPDLYQSDIPVYPVPNPDFPFLGVHLTPMIDGSLKVGPNAVLSFDREGYNGFEIKIADALDIVSNKAIYKLVKDYKATVLKEMLKQKSKTFFENKVKKYWSSFSTSEINGYSCGIRAQATENGELLSDFRIETYERQVHVLNAPSPAATSCLAIADTILEKLNKLINN